MPTYLVGADGATVFNKDGQAIATLRPGYVVVTGRLLDPGSEAGQYLAAKRIRHYPNKRVEPAEDK